MKWYDQRERFSGHFKRSHITAEMISSDAYIVGGRKTVGLQYSINNFILKESIHVQLFCCWVKTTRFFAQECRTTGLHSVLNFIPPLYTFFFRGELWLKCLARRPGPPAFRLSGFDSSSSELLDSVDFLLSLKKSISIRRTQITHFYPRDHNNLLFPSFLC